MVKETKDSTPMCNDPYQMCTKFPQRNGKGTAVYSVWNDPGCFSGLRECLKSAGIPENTANIILSSWRGNTQKQYGTYLKKWSKFCDRSKIDKFQPSIADLLKFLTELHDSGLGYSAVNTAKSAISSFLCIADPNHC